VHTRAYVPTAIKRTVACSVWARRIPAVCASIYHSTTHYYPHPNPDLNPIPNPKPKPNPKSYPNFKLFNE